MKAEVFWEVTLCGL